MSVSQALTLTEVPGSVNATANTSKVRILWQSTQSGNSRNEYTKTAKYYVSINGGAATEYSVTYTLPPSTTKTILDTTITVAHKSDGSGTIKVSTWMDTSISAGVIEKSQSLTLTTIPRASTLTSASDRILGKDCAVNWTPLSASFRYKLKFTLGSFSYTTGAIHPNTVAAYTYTGYSLPIADIAPQITGKPPTGTMTVTLYTYSDANATSQVGSASSKTFKVTVPDNATTKPDVTVTLSPVTPYAKFSSLYLQGRSKVKVTLSGKGKYDAKVTSYSVQMDGVSHATASTFTSDILKNSGSVTIVGTATDSRGFFGTTPSPTSINVIAYGSPYIAPSSGYKRVICERCTEDGTASDTGTYLHIKGTRNYTKINTNGIVNTCSVKCRYKPEGGSWSHDSGDGIEVLSSSNTATDEFDMILPNIVSDVTLSYTVELNIVDGTEVPTAMIFIIPSENVDFELREGGKGAAFGKHALVEDLLDCAWNANFHKNLSIRDEPIVDFVVEQGTSGIWHYRKWYSGKAECWGRDRVSVDISTSWVNVFYGTADGAAFPTNFFTNAPMCQITHEFGDTQQGAWRVQNGSATKDYAPSSIFCRPREVTASFDILYYAFGEWK